MVKEDKATWKANYFLKLQRMLDEYPKSFIVGVDNVGSKQMQEIRLALRGNAELMMGKNTMIRKVIRGNLQKNPRLEKLLGHIVGNVGFVFTKGDMSEVRELILEKKVAAPAKAGALAPIDVFIDAQNTGLGPEKTSFFQALSIPTKIAKGTIEILSKVHLIKAGERVGASEATLLNMLDISPFTYGLVIQMVYDDGTVFEPHVLDMTQADLRAAFPHGRPQCGGVEYGDQLSDRCQRSAHDRERNEKPDGVGGRRGWDRIQTGGEVEGVPEGSVKIRSCGCRRGAGAGCSRRGRKEGRSQEGRKEGRARRRRRSGLRVVRLICYCCYIFVVGCLRIE